MNKIKILVAVILGFLAAITALSYLSSREAQITQAQELKQVYVATDDVRRGTQLDSSLLATRNIPEGYVQPGALTKPDEIVGRVARVEILKGEQILETKLSARGQEALSQLILPEPDQRAVTLPINAVTGVAGLIKPGDRVDVLGTFQVTMGKERFTEVRLVEPALLILAVDQNTQPGVGPGKPTEKGFGPTAGAGSASLVTLLARANVAQKLVLAQKVGELTLLLRRAGDSSQVQLPIFDTRILLGEKQLWQESRELPGFPGVPPPPAGGR